MHLWERIAERDKQTISIACTADIDTSRDSAADQPLLTPISSSVLLLAAAEVTGEGEEEAAHGDEQECCFLSEDHPHSMLYFQK